MILNGDEIIQCYSEGKILITPWDEKRVGTNSYDVVLHPVLRRYTHHNRGVPLNPREKNETEEIIIPTDGYKLCAGKFVLGCTDEYCENKANDIVPMIEGRSSVARLGLSIHVTAGFGDVGFCGRWTLEIIAAEDIIIYPRMPIGQLYWIRTNKTTRAYKGKYLGQLAATESRLNQEKF
jgi:dCTP deaminase